jgi:hypothetical protein
MRNGLGGLGALLVLGLGLGMLRSGSAPSTNPTTGKQTTAREVPTGVHDKAANSKPYCAEQDLIDTIEAFLPAAKASEDTTCKSGKQLYDEFSALTRASNINFAIAIVPDPVHTHLSLFFDRTMDAIQQGAQQANWIFDRATMPWENQEHPESTDYHVRLQQEDYQGGKEELPGLMIFRPADPEKKPDTPLFVFVVGETPTGGVNKKQFRAAIRLMVAGAGTPKAETPLRIIGPTFSGSLYSLAQLLQHQQEPQDQKPAAPFASIVIRSGTVSSWETTHRFQNRQWSDNQLTVDFATFQQSDQYMLRKFVEFEKGRGYEADKIALLAEDETAYGNQGPASSSTPKPPNCPKDPDAQSVKDKPGDPTTLQADENCLLHLYFPRDISQLRSAYQQGFAPQSSSSDSYQVRSTLPVNLQDSGSDDDTVPQYAHSQTPLSQESILLGIVATIRARHIQFVVLQATNPMDTLFLSVFLKKGYSEARVVAMPADLLLSRDADDVSLLHGVMALTTYSLLPDIDKQITVPAVLAGGKHVDHIFDSAYAVGTYNAALSQTTCIGQSPLKPGCGITVPPAKPDPAAPLPSALYAQYGWPALGGAGKLTTPLAPVVWLTVLGRDGFWPLAVLDDGIEAYRAGEITSLPKSISIDPCPDQDPGRTEACGYRNHDLALPWPTFLSVVCGVVLMLTAVYGLLLWKGSIRATSSAMTLLAPIKDPSRSMLIVAVGWLLLLTYLLLLWPWEGWVTLGLLPLGCVLIGSAAVAVLCGICTSELERREDLYASRTFTIGAALLIAFFAALPGHTKNPFLYRYVHLTSGVSPLLPFLCLLAGGLWWAWFSLSGLTMVDKRRPRLPFDADLPHSTSAEHIAPLVTSPFWPSEEYVAGLIRVAQPSAWDSRVYGPAIVLLLVMLFALNFGHPLLSLETRHFEWAYGTALGIVTFVLFCALLRLLVMWLECRRILTTLENFPLRRAFADLHLTWEPIWRLGGGRWQDLYKSVSRQMETLEGIWREEGREHYKEGAKELVGMIQQTAQAQENLRHDFSQTLRTPGADAPTAPTWIASPESGALSKTPQHAGLQPQNADDFIEEYAALQKLLARTCAAALKYLQPKWLDDEGLIVSEATSSEDEKKDDRNPRLSLATSLTERFVALVYTNFILSMLLRMRTLVITAGGLYIFLLLSVNSYPFEPKIALRSAAIMMLVIVVSVVGYVFAHIHRDSILSLVMQTKPGELGMEFWLRMGSFVALPLISLLVSQFPSLNNAVFSWLEPAVNALK